MADTMAMLRTTTSMHHRFQSLQNVAAAPVSPPQTTIDQQVIDIVRAGLEIGETHEVGFGRKEAALRDLFGALQPRAALEYAKRLELPRQGDPVAEVFLRLTSPRRTRLIAYLRDARRREALAVR